MRQFVGLEIDEEAFHKLIRIFQEVYERDGLNAAMDLAALFASYTCAATGIRKEAFKLGMDFLNVEVVGSKEVGNA